MGHDPNNIHLLREKIFRSFKDSNGEEWENIFNLEKSNLFDYLIRLTGKVLGASESLEEVFHSLKCSNATYESYQELRAVLFATVRSFNAQFWNTDSIKLMPPSVSLEPMKISSVKAHISKQEMLTVERSFSSLPPWERETLLLNLREEFSFAEIASIMSMDQKVVTSNFYSGLKRVKRDCRDITNQVPDLIKSLPRYTSPSRKTHYTMDLGDFMADLKESRGKSRKANLFLAFFIIWLTAALVLVYHFFIGTIFELFDTLSSWIRGGFLQIFRWLR